MKSIKKILTFVLITAMAVASLTACGGTGENSSGTKGKKLSIVTTIFPEYDWVREITKDVDGVEITLLMDTGADLHSYQPTAEDIMKISTADIFIYVGGESDKWVDDALKNATNKDLTAVNLMEVLAQSIKEEEVVEGMQGEDEEEDGEEGHTHDDAEEEEETEYDEHVWLSLKNAEKAVSYISDVFSSKDSENSETYTSNANAYNDKLAALDTEYKKAVDEGSFDTVLFGDRFPFRYMVDDYGIKYYAAFVGCSAETEASFETVKFLADKVDELGLHHVLTTEKTDGKIAKTIVDTAAADNVDVLALDSMQSVTVTEVEAGETYYGIMEKNLDVLKEALK